MGAQKQGWRNGLRPTNEVAFHALADCERMF